MVVAGVFHYFLKTKTYTPIFITMTYNMITTQPQKIQTYDQILKTFELSIWIVFIVTVVCASLFFKLIHSIYKCQPFAKYALVKQESYQLDFFILTLCTLTEPDSIPFFKKKPIAGKQDDSLHIR